VEEAQKSDLVNGSTIDDLLIGRGQITAENTAIIIKETFSTDSLGRNS